MKTKNMKNMEATVNKLEKRQTGLTVVTTLSALAAIVNGVCYLKTKKQVSQNTAELAARMDDEYYYDGCDDDCYDEDQEV